jgi:hypothetical protein
MYLYVSAKMWKTLERDENRIILKQFSQKQTTLKCELANGKEQIVICIHEAYIRLALF